MGLSKPPKPPIPLYITRVADDLISLMKPGTPFYTREAYRVLAPRWRPQQINEALQFLERLGVIGDWNERTPAANE